MPSWVSPSQNAPAGSHWLVHVMNDERFNWVRSQSMRRRIVPLNALLGASTAAALWFGFRALDSGQHALGLSVLGGALAVMVMWMMTTGWLNASVRGAADPLVGRLPGGHDERQRDLHADAVRRCYLPMLIVLGGAMLVLAVAPLTKPTAMAVFFSAFCTAVMAPLWTMAWRLPDDDTDG
jgi:hypothetical protein